MKRAALTSLLLSLAGAAHAQQDSLSRVLIRKNEALTLIGFGLAAAAISPADERLARWMRSGDVQGPNARGIAGLFNFVGDPGTLVGSAGIWAFGAITHRRNVADAGLHIGESVVSSAVITGVLKVALGRSRPYVTADSNSHDLQFMRGRKGGQYQSLPSGHATAAFAFAAALAAESPGKRWVAPVAYGAATLVALARMYDDRHWASDVLLGAGIGIASGKATVRFNHARPGNWVDRTFLPSADNGSFHLSVWRSGDGRTNVGLARGW